MNNAKEFIDRGIDEVSLHDYLNAIITLNKAITLDCRISEAYLWRGLAKKGMQDFNGAISDVSEVLKINCNNAIALLERGLLRINIKDFLGAIIDFNKILEIDPDNSNVLNLIVYSKGRIRRYIQKMEEYKAVSENELGISGGSYFRGRCQN